MSELDVVAARIESAKVPEDVFGDLHGDNLSKALGTVYRALVVVVHPDHYASTPGRLPTAEKAFKRLTALKGEAERKIAEHTYGDRAPAPPAVTSAPPMDPIVVEVRKRRFTVGDRLWQGDICDLYKCTVHEPSGDVDAVFKIAQHASDNDLVENEGKILTHLYPASAKDEKFFRYLTRPIDSFILRSKTSNRRASVLPRVTGYFPLSDVRSAFPGGIDFRDMVWMFKRLLSALGFIHRQGVVHGAVLPPHVLVHPVTHGAKLIDWCYAVRTDTKQHVKAISAPYRPFYAPEILRKEPPVPATDIYMAAKCALDLLQLPTSAAPMPRQLEGFLQGCLMASPQRRPDDAWALHDELDQLLQRLVGPPKYRPFHMPTTEPS